MENLITKLVEKAGADKVMHCLVCMVVTMAAAAATGSAAVGAATAMAIGIGKELYDKATGEEFDWRDVAADAAGAVAAWALCALIGN